MSDLFFFLNGRKVVLSNVDPRIRLADYLRSEKVGLTGTKKNCGEGGCGACTVMLSHYDNSAGEAVHMAINSCLRPLGSLDGMAVTTVEGIGSVKTGVSPVQYRIAADNGTQCGFCTPGFVMTMHSFLAANSGRKVTKKEIENAFNGNLCRCTGYRPILQAMKTFASDWTEEDEKGLMTCEVEQLRDVNIKEIEHEFPDELKKKVRNVHFEYNGCNWYRPLSLEDLFHILSKHGKSNALQLVSGNTYPVEGGDTFIDISQIEALREIKIENNHLIIGAGVTYSQFIRWLDENTAGLSKEEMVGLQAMRYMAERSAGSIVRNVASFGGNVMRATLDPAFPSDMFTCLYALNTSLKMAAGPSYERSTIPLSDFLHDYENQSLPVILFFEVPLTGKNDYFRTYKIARRHDNDVAIVNAGLRVRLDSGNTVKDVALTFGIKGLSTFRAKKAEAFLAAKQWRPRSLNGDTFTPRFRYKKGHRRG